MPTFAQVQAAISQAQPVAFSGGTNLLHDEKTSWAVTAVCDFSATGIPSTGYKVDMTQYANRMQVRTIQTIFLDNLNNNGYANVYLPQFDQSFALPAGYQGYFQILGAKLGANAAQITSTGNQKVNVMFLNALMQPAVWAGSVTPPSTGLPQAVSDAILDATVKNNRQQVYTLADEVTASDHSGTIAVGGTSQVLLGANPNRQGFMVQNIDDSLPAEALWICPTGAAVIGGAGSIGIAAAASVGYPGGSSQYQWSNQIEIIGATAGHKFTCIEW